MARVSACASSQSRHRCQNVQGWNWSAIFKRKEPEEPAEQQPQPTASTAEGQAGAEDGTIPSPFDSPPASPDTQQEQHADMDAASNLPLNISEDIQPLQQRLTQRQRELAASQDKDITHRQAQQGLPLQQQQLDEELLPLRQRLQQRQMDMTSSKRLQQQPQLATPAKASRLLLSTPSPARQQRSPPEQTAGGRSIADLQRFAFDASKQRRTPTGAAVWTSCRLDVPLPAH
jgi:hypothetical protein